MKSFKELKSNKESLLKKFSEDLANLTNSGQQQTDDRFWYPGTDKVGNGYAVIRFMPPGPKDDVAFVRVFRHSFQGPSGAWYIENSLTTLGQQDPVSEYNTKLWNSGNEEDKEIARKQKRKLEFICNVYVVKDPENPENEGKVFLFRFGKKIYDKLDAVMNPKFEGDEPMNPFDLWEGANFKIRIRQKDGYRNYDESSFENIGPLFKDDSKLEEVWNNCYELSTFIAEDQFKSYDDLKKRLDMVLAEGSSSKPSKDVMKASNKSKVSEEYQDLDNGVEIDMDYFKSLAEGE